MRRVARLALVPILFMVLLVPEVSGENDLKMDMLRFRVIKGPDAQLVAMQRGVTDVWPDLLRTADKERLHADSFLVTQDLGFHMGYIAYNIRDTATIKSYYRPEITYWPLHDVEFRHALIHSYDQMGIIPPIYGYVVTPVRSLVPPAQSKYYNAAVPPHTFNQGDPTLNPGDEGFDPHSTSGILKEAGYNFIDVDTSGTVTDADYWECPDGSPLPYMEIWTPSMGDAPKSYQHGAEFVADLNEVGLAATTANGNHGLNNMGRDPYYYLLDVFDFKFDAFMLFHGLGRLPSQLHSLLHSSHNPPGVIDPIIDRLCETVKFSLDTDEIEVAAKQIQEMIYTPDKTVYPNADNFALAYMVLYSRSYSNAYNPNLRGIVKSPGYGSDNSWTFLNMYWEPGTERIEDEARVAVWTLDYEPKSFNPLNASSDHEWEILDRSYDGLINMNPYNHHEIPWLASDWAIRETARGMEIDFTLREDVYWQDGYQFTAYDVKFSLEFLRDYHVPIYALMWSTLIDVVVMDATHFTVQADETGINLFYDYASQAAMLPPQIWNRTWPSNQAVLTYDPTAHPYGTDMAPGYSPGPWADLVPTNLFGTGPWIYQFYDEVNLYCDMKENENYFITHIEIRNLLREMFWEVGDADTDGNIDGDDHYIVSIALGYEKGESGYNPDADFNQDDTVDIADLAIAQFYTGWQKEYP